jgi:hypothetical protein
VFKEAVDAADEVELLLERHLVEDRLDAPLDVGGRLRRAAGFAPTTTAKAPRRHGTSVEKPASFSIAISSSRRK